MNYSKTKEEWIKFIQSYNWNFSICHSYQTLCSVKSMKRDIRNFIHSVKRYNKHSDFGVFYLIIDSPFHRKHIHSLWKSDKTLLFTHWKFGEYKTFALRKENQKHHRQTAQYFVWNLIEREFAGVQYKEDLRIFGSWNKTYLLSCQ